MIELFLRHQSIVELDYRNTAISEYVHHLKPGYDESGVDSVPVGACNSGARPFTILFLGDSWIEGGEIVNRVAEHLAEEKTLESNCFELLNAGVTSYSPLLYTLKARKVAKTRDLDMVVVNIDETDLMDDWLRYRPAEVRDPTGDLVRVSFSRDPAASRDHAAYLDMTLERWFLVRLVKKAIYIGFTRPSFERSHKIKKATYENILAPQLSRAPEKTHPSEIAYFRRTVEEMIGELSRLTGGSHNILITFHPHYLGMSTAPASQRYSRVVPQLLAELSARNGATYYDATSWVAEIYAKDSGRFFRWPDDPFSHLSPDGYGVYGGLIAQQLAGAINRSQGATAHSR